METVKRPRFQKHVVVTRSWKIVLFFSQNRVHGYVHHSVVAVFSFVIYSSDPCNTVHIYWYIQIKDKWLCPSEYCRMWLRIHDIFSWHVSTVPLTLQSLWGHRVISGELSPSKSTDWLTNYGMSPWRPLLGLPSWCPIFKSSHFNSFLIWDRSPEEEIFGCPIIKWVAVT